MCDVIAILWLYIRDTLLTHLLECKLSQVNGRILRKQLHIATPHLTPSTCQKQIISRKKTNEAIKAAVRAGKGEKQNLKRVNTQPKTGYFYTLSNTPETIQPLPYVDLV